MNDMSNENVNMASTPIDTRPDEMLTQLAHEAAEHQRVWGLVSSLASLVKNRDQEIGLLEDLLRSMQPYSPAYVEGQNQRIHHLEGRIGKQKHAFNRLEECRKFEKETEEILAKALRKVCTQGNQDTASWSIAKEALDTLKERKGPRPKAEDGS